jgi:stringent starvation protein B
MAFPPPADVPEVPVPASLPPAEPEAPAAAGERVVQLTVADASSSDDDAPRPTPPAGGSRPALKRVK